MTKHTKHQILGVLVIIGLIVLALPLFQRHKNVSMDNPLKETPPFPDQSVQVMSPENNDAPVITQPASVQTEETPPPLPSAMPAQEPAVEQTTKPVTTDEIPAATDNAKESETAPVVEPKPSPSLTPEKPVSSKNSPSKNPGHTLTATASSAVKTENKPALTSSAWVVQLGSFKNKANALRLVNKLRSNGYHAFMESSHSNITRVLVGPETKKTDARKLADQVNTATHLQGMIITYKPLTL